MYNAFMIDVFLVCIIHVIYVLRKCLHFLETDSVCNNESYLCAIGETRDVLRQIDNHSPDHTPQAYSLIKSSGRSTIKRAHTVAVKSPFPITPSSWRQRQESSARNGQLSKYSKKCSSKYFINIF